MFRILGFPLIVFGIVCITGCPPPDHLAVLTEKGDRASILLEDSIFRISLSAMRPWLSDHKKEIGLDIEVTNKTNNGLQLICSRSTIYSKNDTFTWRSNLDRYGNKFNNDSIILTPGYSTNLRLYFVGKKKYSRWSFRKTNRRDTLYFDLNLCDIDTVLLPMRNHHLGFVWNTY